MFGGRYNSEPRRRGFGDMEVAIKFLLCGTYTQPSSGEKRGSSPSLSSMGGCELQRPLMYSPPTLFFPTAVSYPKVDQYRRWLCTQHNSLGTYAPRKYIFGERRHTVSLDKSIRKRRMKMHFSHFSRFSSMAFLLFRTM